MAICFAIVGIIFISMPDGVLRFFNSLSPAFAFPQSSLGGYNFYLVLAAAYMYIVSALAYLMYRHPRDRYFPLLLINAKLASSLLSLVLFLADGGYLVYLANFAADAAIGMGVFLLYLTMKKEGQWESS